MTIRKNTSLSGDTRRHSKAFNICIETLFEELDLAIKWERPSILFALNKSQQRQKKAQIVLEQLLTKDGRQIVYVKADASTPDIIRLIGNIPERVNTIFYVTGIGAANQASGGEVFRGLNMKRELLVEKKICVVFWLSDTEMTDLSVSSPDFWAFRHRVIEFASGRSLSKMPVAAGMLLWGDDFPLIGMEANENSLSDCETAYMRLLSNGNFDLSTRAEILLKLLHQSWLEFEEDKFLAYLQDGLGLAKEYPASEFQAGLHNAMGIRLYEDGDKQSANEQFALAMMLDPANVAARMNVSLVSCSLGRCHSAIREVLRVIKSTPVNFRLWYVLGYIYLILGQIEDATRSLLEARRLSDNLSLNVRYLLAVCYCINEQADQCLREFMEIEASTSLHTELQVMYASLLRSILEKSVVGLEPFLNVPNLHRDPVLQILLPMQGVEVSGWRK